MPILCGVKVREASALSRLDAGQENFFLLDQTRVEVQTKGSTWDERYVQTTKMRGLETRDRTKKQVSGIQVLDF
jgi:hypothetical protein